MSLYRNVVAWLFGCRASYVRLLGWEFYCTLPRLHRGWHEAHDCGCAGRGRCAYGPKEEWER